MQRAGIYEETLQKRVDGEALLLGFRRDEGFDFQRNVETHRAVLLHKGYRIGAREWPWCSHPAASFGGRNEPVSGWLGRDALGIRDPACGILCPGDLEAVSIDRGDLHTLLDRVPQSDLPVIRKLLLAVAVELDRRTAGEAGGRPGRSSVAGR